MERPLVLVVAGSESDLDLVSETTSVLSKFDVPHKLMIASAHRTPAVVVEAASGARKKGVEVIIAAAGLAAHLPGVIAAHTTLPVIGIPVPASTLGGLDSLLSIAQMPSGIPVAAVSIGKAGAVNAAMLALSILALRRPALARRLGAHRRSMARKVEAANRRLAAAGKGD